MLAVLGGCALVAGCASARVGAPDPDLLPDFGAVPVLPRREIAPAAAAGLANARRLAGLGLRGQACAQVRAVLAAHPETLDADRFLQDLLVGTRSDAWLRRRYEIRRERNPEDADSLYLAARIEPSRAKQSQLFQAALDLDPAHPWARLGRAVSLERRGEVDGAVQEAWRTAVEAPWFAAPWLYLGAMAWSRGAPEAAERFLREAIARSPEEVRAWSALAAAYDDLDRPADASRAALEALRRAPGEPATLWTTARLLERCGAESDLETALATVDSARATCAHPEDAEAFRGRMLVALRRFPEAERTLVEARRLGASVGDTAVPLRRARIGAGRVREAVEEYVAGLPGDVLADGDSRAPAWRELIAAARGDDGERVVRALTAVGWGEHAADVRRAARRHDRSGSVADGSAPDHADRPDGRGAFLRDLGRYSRDLRRSHKRGGSATLEDVLARVRDLAALHGLGDRATDGVRVRDFTFLGSFATSSDSAGPFRDLFLDQGLLLIVGQRSGQGAEMLVGRIVSERRGVRAQVLGEEVEYDECWIESEGLPDGLAGLRGGLAGLTLDRFVTLQLDVIRRGAPRDDVDLPYAARAATDDSARRALDTPSDVAGRIEIALDARGTLDRDELDAVLRHERVHVRDAQRLLPPLSHPFAALSFALSHGFSASRMERALEARAAVGALVDADEPRAALASLTAFLPAEDGDTPHVAGYRDALAAAVDEIVRDPGAFPSIDPDWNVAQQFDRLTSAEIRELGRRLARRME